MIDRTVPQLIGLTGPAGCGKDTVGRFLRRYHGYKAVSFAEPIRAACQMLFGIDDFKMRDYKEMKIDWIGKSPRQLMQLLGTEFGRHYVHPDIWIRHLQRRIDSARVLDPAQKFVITDVRFQNCANWVHKESGQVWHIQRSGLVSVSSHVSEDGVDFNPSMDRLLTNNATFEELERQIGNLITDRVGSKSRKSMQPVQSLA